MKGRRWIGVAIAAGVLLAAVAADAQTTDATDSVPATLTIGASASLDIQARNVSNDATAAGLGFAAPGGGETTAPSTQYVEVAYASNHADYRIRTRTDNGWSDGGYFGAMLGSDTTYRAWLRWRVLADTVSGGPAFDVSTVDDGTWINYKDEGDPDYAGAVSGNYTQVVAGGTWGSKVRGDDVTVVASPVALYVGSIIDALPADAYSTVLHFDLIHL